MDFIDVLVAVGFGYFLLVLLINIVIRPKRPHRFIQILIIRPPHHPIPLLPHILPIPTILPLIPRYGPKLLVQLIRMFLRNEYPVSLMLFRIVDVVRHGGEAAIDLRNVAVAVGVLASGFAGVGRDLDEIE